MLIKSKKLKSVGLVCRSKKTKFSIKFFLRKKQKSWQLYVIHDPSEIMHFAHLALSSNLKRVYAFNLSVLLSPL